jgi:hypothetical protein
VSFIMLGTFVALNSLIGVIVTALQRIDCEDESARIAASLARIEAALAARKD